MTTLELGPGKTPDPRADETVDLYARADHQFDLDEDWPLPDDYASSLLAHHVVEHLDIEHFWGEARRVVEPAGVVEITLPIGRNAATDTTHGNSQYTLDTLRHWGIDQRRHWDPQTGFRLIDLDWCVWLDGPLSALTPVYRLATRLWPDELTYRASGGEITGVYINSK